MPQRDARGRFVKTPAEVQFSKMLREEAERADLDDHSQDAAAYSVPPYKLEPGEFVPITNSALVAETMRRTMDRASVTVADGAEVYDDAVYDKLKSDIWDESKDSPSIRAYFDGLFPVPPKKPSLWQRIRRWWRGVRLFER